jgi:predicted DNA-binding transcriptional regulator YafY
VGTPRSQPVPGISGSPAGAAQPVAQVVQRGLRDLDAVGADFGERLEIGLRTVRRDIDRLRELGYPVEATPGVAGGYQARILFHAPLEQVAPRTSPAAGRLEAVDAHTCLFHAGSNSLHELAVYVAAKGFDFEVLDPPELRPVLRGLSDRLSRAADRSTG